MAWNELIFVRRRQVRREKMCGIRLGPIWSEIRAESTLGLQPWRTSGIKRDGFDAFTRVCKQCLYGHFSARAMVKTFAYYTNTLISTQPFMLLPLQPPALHQLLLPNTSNPSTTATRHHRLHRAQRLRPLVRRVVVRTLRLAKLALACLRHGGMSPYPPERYTHQKPNQANRTNKYTANDQRGIGIHDVLLPMLVWICRCDGAGLRRDEGNGERGDD